MIAVPESALNRVSEINSANELVYRIALSLVPGVGPVKARNLVAFCGSAEAVFREKKNYLLRIPDIGEITVVHVAADEVAQSI